MKSKIQQVRLLLCIFFCLLIFAPISCSKHETSNASIRDQQLIKSSLVFFETKINPTHNPDAYLNDGNKRKALHKNVDWSRATITTLSIGKVVVVPVYTRESLFVKYGTGNLSLSVNNITYLLIYGKGDGMKAEVVTKFPDEKFVYGHDDHRSFTGTVRVETWSGEYVRGYKYDNKNISSIGKSELFTKSPTELVGNKSKTNTSSNVHPDIPPPTCGIDWYTCSSGGGETICTYSFSTPDCPDGAPGGSGGNPGNPDETDYGQVGIVGTGSGGGGGGVSGPLQALCASSFNYQSSSSFYLTNMSGLTFEDGTEQNLDVGSVYSLTNGITDGAMNTIVSSSNDYFGLEKSPLQYLLEFFPQLFTSGDITSSGTGAGKIWKFSVFAARKISARASNLAQLGVVARTGGGASKPGLNIAWVWFRQDATRILKCFMPGSQVTQGFNSNGTRSTAIYEIGCN